MGWSSHSDLIAEITGGKYAFNGFQKTSTNGAASAAGRWHEFYTATGMPAAGALTGTAGTAVQIKQSVQGAGLYIGSDVSPDTRHLLTLQAFSPTATLVPATAVLCDFLLYYPSVVLTGTPTTLTNTATLPRYTDGIGVMAIAAVQTAVGAAAPALTLTVTYDDATTTPTGVLTAPAVSAPVSTLFLNNGMPYFPIGAGKKGIKSINSYTLASGTTGTAAFFLVKPLTLIPILAVNTASERDLLVQLPSLPRVYDDACLAWVIQVGGAMATSSVLGGYAGIGWG